MGIKKNVHATTTGKLRKEHPSVLNYMSYIAHALFYLTEIVRMQYHKMQFGTRYLQWSMVLQDPKQHFCYGGRK